MKIYSGNVLFGNHSIDLDNAIYIPYMRVVEFEKIRFLLYLN